MAVFLIIVIGLVIWSLRLLQGSLRSRDSALMLASTLVAISAGGVIVVYLLMDGCLSHLTTSRLPASIQSESLVSIPAILYEPDVAISDASTSPPSLTN